VHLGSEYTETVYVFGGFILYKIQKVKHYD